MQIVDQFGRPIQSHKTPDRNPLAAAPLYDSWREYVLSGLTPEKLAAILKSADAGDVARQAELFEQLEEKDGHLIGEMGKRRNVILDVDFKVIPASDDARDQKVADFVQEWMQGLTDLADTWVALQDAVGNGYSGLEVMWDASEGQAVPTSFDPVEKNRFLFTDEKGVLSQTPRLITDDAPMGVEIPAWKMLFHKYGGKSGNPMRAGIYRVCAWMHLFKNYAIKDWVIFCEVYGMPLRLGKYDPNASPADKNALKQAVASIGTDAAGIISKSTEIEFLESVKGKASGDLYKALCDFANKEISKAILGQTLTADVGDTGSYAASQTHNDVRVDLLKADSRACAATFRSQAIRPMVGFNFGWDTPCPGLEAPWEEPEDLKAKAEWMTRLMDRVVMGASFVRREFNIPEPEEGEETIGGAPVNTSMPMQTKLIAAKGNLFSPAQMELEDLAEKSGRGSEQAMAQILGPIREVVAKATSLEELRENILNLYPGMESTDLETALTQALVTAGLHGVAEAGEKPR